MKRIFEVCGWRVIKTAIDFFENVINNIQKKQKNPSLKIASNKLFSCVQTFIVDIFNQVGCLLLTYLNISKVGAFVKDWK